MRNKPKIIAIFLIICLFFIGLVNIFLSSQHLDYTDIRYQYTQTRIPYATSTAPTTNQHKIYQSLRSIYASHLSTKTPYHASRQHITYDLKYSRNLKCEPIHINHITRHGTKYPLKLSVLTKLTSIIARAQKWSDQHHINQPEVEKMSTWLDDFDQEMIKQELAHVGRSELYGVGYRLAQSYPSLFTRNDTYIIMESTNRTRTQYSRRAFIDGMHHAAGTNFGVQMRLPDVPNIDCSQLQSSCPASHLSLLFYMSCPLYTRYKHERTWMKESHAFVEKHFTNTSDAYHLLSHIFTQPFVHHLWSITNTTTSHQFSHHIYKLIRKFYQLCQLQKSILDVDEEWCSLFWEDHGIGEREEDGVRHGSLLSLMEYNEDLKTSSLKGHGTALAHDIACPLLTSFLDTIASVIIHHEQGDIIPSGYFRFAHAETLMPFFAVMGLYNDTIPLSSTTYPAASRAWRTSSLTPMGGNMYWITHVCNDVWNTKTYHLSLYHNERLIPFPIPGCMDRAICEWERIRDHYSQQMLSDGVGRCTPEDVAKVCHDGDIDKKKKLIPDGDEEE